MYFTPKKPRVHLESPSLCYEPAYAPLSPAWPSTSFAGMQGVTGSEPAIFQIISHWASISLSLSGDVFLKIFSDQQIQPPLKLIKETLILKGLIYSLWDLHCNLRGLNKFWSRPLCNSLFSPILGQEAFILVKHKKLPENSSVFSKKVLVDWGSQKEKYL